MKAPQKAVFRRRLIEERDRIVAEWQNHGGDTGPDPDWNLRNAEERASQISTEQIDRKITDDDRNLLAKVELALQRLEDGSYCQCAKCGGTIPMDRLKAKPSASLCLTCQEAKDAQRT